MRCRNAPNLQPPPPDAPHADSPPAAAPGVPAAAPAGQPAAAASPGQLAGLSPLARLAAIVPDTQALDDAQPHYLWPEHAQAWQLFCIDLRTQWRWGGMGSRTGLDYGACIQWLALRHKRDRVRTLVDELGVLERAFLDEEAAERARNPDA